MSYRIITDSSCDFTKQQYKDFGLLYTSLQLNYPDKTVPSYTEPDELHAFYDGLRAGDMPTTNAVNPEAWGDVMQPVLEAGEDVLCLAFSSGLSTTYQSAVIAAGELSEKYPDRKIRVVDTLCAAMGEGLIVWHACQLRNGGKSLDEVADWVEANRDHLAHWVTVNDLNHLKRGGRVSATTAFVGGLLGIKPIIHVDVNGKLDTVAKVRGRKASIDYLANKVKDTCTDFENVFICHGDCPEDAAILEAKLKELGVKNVTTGYVGGVIGAHTGPGVLVACFLATEK